MSDDPSLDELEERARRALKVEEFKPGALSAEEQLVARQLMGTGNAERVARAKPGQRVRLVPTVTWYEFYQTPGTLYSHAYWRLDRMVNNRRESSRDFANEDELRTEIAKLRSQNITVREIHMGVQPRLKDKPRTSERKAQLERLRGFRA